MDLVGIAKVIDTQYVSEVCDGCNGRANDENRFQVESRNVGYESKHDCSAKRFISWEERVSYIRDVRIALTRVRWTT